MKNVPVQYCQTLEAEANGWPKQAFPPLDQVGRPTVPTSDAAYYLNRKSQTLRTWACLENGPIRPVRINGRLAWPVSKIKDLLKGGSDGKK